ncbi:MAG TPA: CoA transferase [Acidimicrobiales bacterium]
MDGSWSPRAMIDRWAASGAMALTGPVTTPLGPPEGLVATVAALEGRFPGLDGLALLGERAALLGLGRQGTVSCGGGCRLLPCHDGWLALSLARPEDHEVVPAWLECDQLPAETRAEWERIATLVSQRRGAELVERGSLLGLPVAMLGDALDRPPLLRTRCGAAPPLTSWQGLRVIDLTALWAGPLCGDLLAGAGASVIKVESTQRPDGARRGPPEFFDLLNGRKQSVALDFRDPEGLQTLHRLVRSAHIVLESSRSRALEQLGLRAADVIAEGRPRLWVSITGYGRNGPQANRVAFGDDAAVSGGLVVRYDDQPHFCADAVADPLSGLTAAHACLDALAEGGRWVLDVAMAAVARVHGGPMLEAPGDIDVAPPRSRQLTSRAQALGAATARIVADLETSGP